MVASAKQAKLEGSPVPTETPKKNEINMFTDISLLGILINRIDITVPVSIQRERNFFLARGKNIDPKMREQVTPT